MSKNTTKYLVPVEITKNVSYKNLGVKIYEYKLYSDMSEQKFSRIKFVDFNGFIIGEHMPIQLNALYDKTLTQMKNATIKAVSEIKSAVDEVADVAISATSEVSKDISKTAKQTATLAVGLFDKVKSFTKDKLKNKDTNQDNLN